MLYTHVKTGNIYEVLDSDAKLEGNMASVVVYRGLMTGKTWVRPVEEFFDGRFVPTRTVESIFKEMKPHEDEVSRLKLEVRKFRENCKHYWQDDSGELWSGKYCKVCGTSE